MKKKKILKKYIYDELLGFGFWLIKGGTQTDAIYSFVSRYKLPHVKDPPGEDTLGSFTHSDYYPWVGLIWIGEKSGDSTIAHEIQHAVVHVCRTLKMSPMEQEEFSALYTGWLKRKINKFIY